MKSIFTVILFSIATLSFSQKKIGVFTGFNYSFFTDGFAGQISGEKSFGLQIGAVYDLALTDKVSFRPKLVFSQQGDRTRTSYNNYGSIQLTELDYKLDYINIPLDIKFWNKIYVIAGPQVGFLINQKIEGRFIGKVKSNVEVGLNLGTGFTINDLFFEFGVYQGLGTLLNYNYQSTGSIIDVRNGLAKFTLGYNFK